MTTAPAERSVPKPVFTDAEAGAKEFPDSTARRFNYYTPTEAQAEPLRGRDRRGPARPAALSRPGLAVRVLRRPGRLPAGLDGAQGMGIGPARAGALTRDRVARATTGPRSAGTSSATRTRSGNSPSTATTPTSSGSSTRTSTPPGQPKAFEQWNPNWVRFVERNVGAWMHVDHGLGLYLFANANRRAPTNMHNNAISVNSMHRIRSAQDLALYNLTLSEEIDGFDGTAHIETWNNDPAWQGVRETAERLTAIDDWCEAIFAANVVFEPLVGRTVPEPPGAARGTAQRRLRHPDGRSARRSTTSPSATCATPGQCSSC